MLALNITSISVYLGPALPLPCNLRQFFSLLMSLGIDLHLRLLSANTSRPINDNLAHYILPASGLTFEFLKDGILPVWLRCSGDLSTIQMMPLPTPLLLKQNSS